MLGEQGYLQGSTGWAIINNLCLSFNIINGIGGYKMKVELEPEYETYYLHSTGRIVGPNYGESLRKKNLKRLDYGNLFVIRREAERARKLVMIAMSIARWRIWPL